jgi:hypothetical protein
MRLVTYDGREYRLSERNWKQMLRRFDAGRARLNTFGYYFVPGKSICVRRSYKCIRCPLRDPRKKTNSCTLLFEKIIGQDALQRVHLRDSGIAWHPKDDAVAKAVLKKVTEVLSGAIQYHPRKKSSGGVRHGRARSMTEIEGVSSR